MKLISIWLGLCLLGLHSQAQYGLRISDAESKQAVPNISVQWLEGNKFIQGNTEGEVSLVGMSGQQRFRIYAMGYQADTIQLHLPLKQWVLHQLRPATTQLKEVMVNTGYQKIAKERATGSFSVVSNQTFNEQIGPDVLSRLEGITPALSMDRRTGGTTTLMVRGLSTLRGDRTPLIILDDFPYAGDLSNVNPNDVESITVLKDAAAASIWGAKAGNGVIVITTKKGSYHKKLQIDANASSSLASLPSLNEYNNLNAADAIAVEQMLFSKGYYNSQENANARLPFTPAVELMIAQRDGKITAAELSAQLSALSQQDIRQNYRNSFMKQAVQQQYSLGLRGGTANMNWYLFAGYDNQRSELGATYSRFNLKLDHTLKLNERLDVGLSLYLTNNHSRSGKTSFSNLTTANGILPAYTQFQAADGSALPVMKNYRTSYVSTLAGGNLLDWNYYPLSDGELMPSTQSKFDVLGNVRLGYQLLKGLKLSLNYQYQRQAVDSRTAYQAESYYVRNLVNQFTQVSGSNLTRALPWAAIYNDGQELITSHNLRGQANYEATFHNFSFNALAGAELRDAQTDRQGATTYGIDTENMTTIAVDHVNPFKNVVTGANMFIPYTNNYGGLVSRYVSAYANAAISYHAKYTLSASVRRDASNVFGVATNDLWNPLWSVGAAWLLSAEQWMPEAYLPYARLRFSYGSSGNSDGKRAAVTTISYNGTSVYTGSPYANFANYANPELKWETVNTLNFGADFKWFNNRLTIAVDYYVKKSKDLIENAPIDYTGGIGSQMYKNTAQISVRGLDLEISSQNTVGALKWSSSLFANFYKDRTDAYYQSSQAAATFVNGSTIVSGVVGMPVYSVYAYKWAGLNPLNGNPRGYVNGEMSEDYATITGAKATLADLAYLGRTFPTLTGALGNSLKWKAISLDFRIAYKFGYYFRRSSLSYGSLYQTRLGDREYSERWQQPGDEAKTNVPSAVYPAVGSRDAFYNFSEATIISGDHIRLQYIGLGYVLSKSKFAKLPFQHITLRAVANNLGLLWLRNKQGIDPDYPAAIPSKIYSFNLQFSL